MSEKPTIQELMNQIADNLILNLKEGEQVCPTCKGLRFILTERGKHSYIESCRYCHTGKVYVCKHCSKSSPTGHCDCGGAVNEIKLEEHKKDLERFNKAEKIQFKDYEGYFLWNERAIDKEDLVEAIFDLIKYNEEYPTYLYTTTKDFVSIGIDICDEITNRCNDDGYEDMDSYVDLNSDKLIQAQKLIDEWVEEQGNICDVYYEDYKRVVLLDELIEEIKNKINK